MIKGCMKHALKSVPIDFKSIAATDSQVKILTDSEVALLLYKLRNRVDLNTVGILFALYTGVRLGELCAVQWKDIDLEQRVCYIRHTLQRIQNPDRKSGEPKTCLHIGLPKNGKERIIPLHDHIVDLLRKIQEKYEPSDYLLSGDFRPTEPRTMENRFKKVLKTCGIREVHFHVLRHTFASQCIESGMDIKALTDHEIQAASDHDPTFPGKEMRCINRQKFRRPSYVFPVMQGFLQTFPRSEYSTKFHRPSLHSEYGQIIENVITGE